MRSLMIMLLKQEKQHHEDTVSMHKTFLKEVHSLVEVLALSHNGQLYKTQKSDLLHILEGLLPPPNPDEEVEEVKDITVSILDGAAIVQMLKPMQSKNFKEYAENTFANYLKTLLAS